MTPPDAAADTRQIIADLERKLAESVAQQAATTEVLRIINDSGGDPTPVFDVILEKAHSLCDITTGSLELYDGDLVRSVATRGMNARWDQYLRQGYKITETVRPAYMAMNPSHVIDMKKVVERFPDEPIFRDFIEIGGLRTFLGVTLTKDGKAFGRIVAARDEVRPFTDKQIELLRSFADQAVIAIENARLLTEQRDALERQTATADILRVISSSVADTTPVFEQILDSCERLAAFSRMAIFLLGEDGQVHVGAYRGSGGDALKATFPQPLANTPMSLAFQSRQALFFGDVLNNPEAPESLRAAASMMGSFSVLVAPLLWEGRGIGAFHVARDAVATFSDKEVALLKTFADQAAIAIQNARLFNETKEALERQTATSDVLQVISSSVSDAAPVFEKILDGCQMLIPCTDLAVLTIESDNLVHLGLTRGPYGLQVASNYRPSPIDDTIIARAVRELRTIHIPDGLHGEDVPDVLRRMTKKIGHNLSCLIAPMKWRGDVVGALFVTRVYGKPFSDNEIALFETFAGQAVIAIQNARLFNETREALEQQTATADILKVIAGSPDDVQPVFQAIAERSNRLVNGLSTTVLSIVDDTIHLSAFTRTTAEADAKLTASFPRKLSSQPYGAPIQRGEIYRVPDTDVEPALRGIARWRGYRSIVFVPLLHDGVAIGMIGQTKSEPGPFAENHIQLLQTFADQAAIAIQNARLFNETKEALERQTATADILKVIASSPSDLQPVFKAIAERSNRLVNGLSTAVFTLVGDIVDLAAFTATNPVADAALKALFPTSLSTFTWTAVVLRGETYSLPDTEEVDGVREVARLRGYRSMLMVPLLHDGKPIGVISQTRREPGPFNDNHVQLLQTFADQAVIAISNVRLFQEVQERTRELSASLDHLRTAQDRLVQTEKLASLGQLTAGIAHEIKNPLNFVNNFAALSGELIEELNDVLKPTALDEKTREEINELTQLLSGNLEKVVQHGKRADSIVKNMLLHSREGSGEHRIADINSIVEESLNLAYHGARAEKAGFNITLKRDFDPAAGQISLYPQEMTRVFLNLISNGFYAAAKRKESGGEEFDPTLSAATRNLGDKVEIRIRDNGTGIPAAVKEKMFNPFFTTKPAGEGTGLGLSMSHDIIVNQHSGSIDVVTEPGAFTEFIITLPRNGAANQITGG